MKIAVQIWKPPVLLLKNHDAGINSRPIQTIITYAAVHKSATSMTGNRDIDNALRDLPVLMSNLIYANIKPLEKVFEIAAAVPTEW